MIQKYSLAVALAVIKSKPGNMSTQEHIATLSKMKDKQMDIDVWSDDFNLDDDSFTHHGDTQVENDVDESMDILRDFEFNDNDAVESNSLRDFDKEIEIAKMKSIKTIPPSINEPTTSKATNFMDYIDTNIDNISENTTTFYANNTEDESMDEHSVLIKKKLTDAVIKNLNKNTSFINMNNEIENNAYYCNPNELNSIQINNNEQTQVKLENSDQTQKAETFTYNEKDKMIQTVTKNLNKDSRIDNENTWLDEFTENYTHVSQSQTQNIEIGKEFIYGNKGQNKNNQLVETGLKIDDIITEKEAVSSQIIDITNVFKLVENNGRKYINLNSNNTQNTSAKADVNSQMDKQDIFDEEMTVDGHNCNENVNDLKEVNTLTEVVPFKIIEELNKIKKILNKAAERRVAGEGSMSDYGYRSDSRSRSSFKSALDSAGNWLNQSAYSLFNYLTQCSLVATTRDINNEIAKVLGKLIDRLHKEEKYPLFLHDILKHIDISLRDIFEGGSSDDLLLYKDEINQRILLLTKSLHILEYTIEKITQKLEELHSNLTKEGDMYELTNTKETENSCYLFHLLEILLKKYVKIKASLSQSQASNQMAQDEDRVLKKGSITDMWRKKWNPNYKELINLESADKKCVLVHCSRVLNKIVVECMEGYSLVAYAALQCFNLLQS